MREQVNLFLAGSLYVRKIATEGSRGNALGRIGGSLVA